MPALKEQFLLDPSVTYLNFGSFGAAVKPVFEVYQQFQRDLESEPAQFFMKRGPDLLLASRQALGKYVNCASEDLVYVPNPSYGVNIVAKSFGLSKGDEVLTTDLEYGACEKTWSYYCRKAGAVLKKMPVPFPVADPGQIAEAVLSGITTRTKLVFISHLTSTTAIILPVKQIVEAAHRKGIPVFVDGAHAPGHISCDIGAIDADMYTGACHKWMLTPKGCAFLYVKKSWQQILDPLVVSWGYESASPSSSQFLDYHEGQGTRDYSAFLTVPASIEFMRAHNWTAVARQCREMVAANAPRFSEFAAGPMLSPFSETFLGQMLSIPVSTPAPEALQKELFTRYRIEVPVMKHNKSVFLRFSVNAFNTQGDLDKLHAALLDLRKEGFLRQ